MKDHEVVEKIVGAINDLRKGLDYFKEGEFEKAKCTWSRVYLMGFARVMDEMKKRQQPSCEHDFTDPQTRGKIAFIKCRKCHFEHVVWTSE